VLAFDQHRSEGEEIRRGLYGDYPRAFPENVRRAWRDLGTPRARYFHNAIGMSSDALVVVQREGTVEELGAPLEQAGAADGIILDNGGSVACWVWWATAYAGGLVSPTVDYRPQGTSAIAFVLKGPSNVTLPGEASHSAWLDLRFEVRGPRFEVRGSRVAFRYDEAQRISDGTTDAFTRVRGLEP
jgi:hypothetical protein